jgi:hypothetical protein
MKSPLRRSCLCKFNCTSLTYDGARNRARRFAFYHRIPCAFLRPGYQRSSELHGSARAISQGASSGGVRWFLGAAPATIALRRFHSGRFATAAHWSTGVPLSDFATAPRSLARHKLDRSRVFKVSHCCRTRVLYGLGEGDQRIDQALHTLELPPNCIPQQLPAQTKEDPQCAVATGPIRARTRKRQDGFPKN